MLGDILCSRYFIDAGNIKHLLIVCRCRRGSSRHNQTTIYHPLLLAITTSFSDTREYDVRDAFSVAML